MVYSAKVPLHMEYVSEYDTHDSSTYAECEFESEIEIKSMVCRLNYSPEGEKAIFIEGIEAHDQIEAFIIVSHLLPLLANAICLYLQRQNINQHYGHMRVKWYKREIQITPPDQYPSVTTSSTIITKIHLDGLQDAILHIWESSELQFMTDAYYGALQSQDHRAKYYHAFTIIEYIENKYKDIGNQKFMKTDCKDSAELVRGYFLGHNYSEEDAALAKGEVIKSLARITLESRAEKLHFILNNYFDIHSVKYFEEVEINKEIVKNLIDIRNRLFHGGNQSELKENLDLLILVCQKILWSLLG